MTKNELFEKYNINESHNQWDTNIDSWISVEIYRLMHNGQLPNMDDLSCVYVCDFLDKIKSDPKWWETNVMSKKNWGSFYLTAKRMVYSMSDNILNELK